MFWLLFLYLSYCFIFIQAAIYIMVPERDEFSGLIFVIVAIATVVALPYMIHIFLADYRIYAV